MRRRISFPFKPAFALIALAVFVISGFLMGHLSQYLFDWNQEPFSTKAILIFWISMMIFCAGLMSALTTWLILFPIKRLVRGTQEIIKGNFSVRIQEEEKISEIKTLAEHFNIMAKALESMEIVHNDFARNVSHEFKTPLSVIKGYGIFLQKEEIEEKDRIMYAQKIVEYADRLTALTDGILLLSKLDNQQTELRCQTFNLGEQIRQVLLLYEKVWSQKNISVILDMPETLLYTGNEELLFQVWQNLVGNALKYTPDGGSIHIFCRQDVLAERECASYLSICFQDTGIGISSEDLPRIFENFYQADKSRAGIGCGLGLALVKKITELHKGTVSVESHPQEGSTFTISLPVTME